jgi:transposase
VLIEGAWAYRLPARVGRKIAARHEGLTKEVIDIAWKVPFRLCQRFRGMCARREHRHVVVTAVARELACFLWSIELMKPLPKQVALAS